MRRYLHRCGVCGRFMRPYPLDIHCDRHCAGCVCYECDDRPPFEWSTSDSLLKSTKA